MSQQLLVLHKWGELVVMEAQPREHLLVLRRLVQQAALVVLVRLPMPEELWVTIQTPS
jgi:hypothetical protein